MCIIIDANIAHCLVPPSEEAKPVFDWIENGDGQLVTGGKNTDELTRNQGVSRWLRVLKQAGRVRDVESELINNEEQYLSSHNLCISNDAHIIALARVSGARIIFSNDQTLHEDFLNRHLICDPRGRVYQTADHRHLLRRDACRSRRSRGRSYQ